MTSPVDALSGALESNPANPQRDGAAVACPPHHWMIAMMGGADAFDERWECEHCGEVKTVSRETRRQAMETKWTPRPVGRRPGKKPDEQDAPAEPAES